MTKLPIRKTLALLAGTLLLANSASAATKTWVVGGTDTNWSSSANWTPAGGPLKGDDAVFGNGGTAYVVNSIPATNDVVDPGFVATLNSLSFNHTNCSYGTLVAGTALVISGTAATPDPLFVGSGADQLTAPALDLVAFWGSSLAITNTSSIINIAETGSSAASPAANRRATLNLSGLNTFSAKVQRLAIGFDGDGLTIHRRPSATLLLAKTNYITCTISG